MHFTKSIILRKVPLGEADALVTAYTEAHGKLRFRAVGAYREPAKLKGHIEPMNYCMIGFIAGRYRNTLTNASVIEYWPRIRTDVDRLQAAWHVTDAIDTAVFEGEHDSALWALLFETIFLLEGRAENHGECVSILQRFLDEFSVRLGLGNRISGHYLGTERRRPTGDML